MKKTAILLPVVAILGCTDTTDQDYSQPIGVGASVSTLGIVVEPTYRIDPKFGIRMPIGFGNANTSTTIDDITYDVDGSTGGIGLLGDYYPTGRAFRISGGVLKSNMELNGRATGNLNVGSGVYVGVDMTTTIKPENEILPMVSLGYDAHLGSGWGLSTDVGAVFAGGYSVTAADATNTVSAADIAAETANVKAELDEYTVIPYIKFGATYRW